MHILFLNPQGNFDPDDKYWTEHPDFGGQLVYVKEIALAMSTLGHTVDILTRRFNDSKITGFERPMDGYAGYPNTRIIRLDAGPNQFLEKEKLWAFLSEWVDAIVEFYRHEKKTIDFITTHYGDGGYAGALLSQKLKVPFSFTGHSLGAQKMDKLGVKPATVQALQNRYQFNQRLLGERSAMAGAQIIFTSTPQEKDEQYTHLAYRDITLPKQAAFVVAPPGVNETVFGADQPNPQEATVHALIETALKRDIDPSRRNKPFIVLASRLDQKKNHLGLLKAYAQSARLKARANIAISLRGVEDAFTSYASLKGEEKELMDQLMALIENEQLKGSVSFINIMSQGALASAYRYFAKLGSVFSLTSTYEPFGLAPIEAMCAGLPAAVTKYGGPADVLEEGGEKFGVLLDVLDLNQMGAALNHLFDEHPLYQAQGLRRVKTAYTWTATAKRYLDAIEKVLAHTPLMDATPLKDMQTADTITTIQNVYLGGSNGTDNDA